ncbi:MAG: ribonuclease III [Planctomycetota bacterium]|nr:ribonuclease III [Planctomycetota bacterium]
MNEYPAHRQEAEERERVSLSHLACLAATHHDRPIHEEPDPFRTCFVRDRDRVLHSGAFRRLKDKTQVFVIGQGDFYRTRLTHSLEVSQMARYLSRALKLNEDLTEVLSLFHDIGHPPFGHEGEEVLNQGSGVAFDHNTQALRIVDVLESPYPDRTGLNLTQIVRASILKHGGDAGQGAPNHPGHILEAQVADLADSTAYQHHDLEDALRAELIDEAMLEDLAIWRDGQHMVDPSLPRPQRLKATLNNIVKTSLHDIIATSSEALMSTSCQSGEEIAAKNERLIRLSPTRAGHHRELAQFLLSAFYRHPSVTHSRSIATEAIGVIVEHYRENPEDLPSNYRLRGEEDGLGRSVCDYVAGMTDGFATDEWRRLMAIRISSPPVSWKPRPTPEKNLSTEERLSFLEKAVGHTFNDSALPEMALTHSSARSDAQPPNERLEFLGDAVLGLIVSQMLYRQFPDREEGEMSRIKSAVVSRHALRRVAKVWGLGAIIRVGGGIVTAGAMPPSIIANAVEAILGAVFLDGGIDAASHVVLRDFGPLIERAAESERGTNHKSELQHFTQGNLGQTPHYRVLQEDGPDHAKNFTVAAIVGNVELAIGTGRNKRQAEQRAAHLALQRLGEAQAQRDWPDGLEPRSSQGERNVAP